MRKPYDRLSRRQLGLVSSAQLARLGWSRHAILHLCERRLLFLVRRGVYRTAGSRETNEMMLLAAVLAAGDGCLLSHATAARTWGFTKVPAPPLIDVIHESWSQPRLAGVRGHRTTWLPDHHRSRVGALPVTSAERTVVDCCGMVSLDRLRSTVADGLRRRVLSLPRLARTVDEVPRSGRRPVVPVVELLKTLVPGYDPGDSDPEVDLVESLVAGGFPRPAQQVRVVDATGTMFIDVGWPDLRVGFEYDSLEFHEHRFHQDRDRLRRLKRAGWDVWPITSTTSRNEILAIATAAFAQVRAA
jgi:hypothetical protein